MFWVDIVHYKSCHCCTIVTFAGEYDSNVIKTDLVLPPRSSFINFKLSRFDVLTAEGLKSQHIFSDYVYQ